MLQKYNKHIENGIKQSKSLIGTKVIYWLYIYKINDKKLSFKTLSYQKIKVKATNILKILLLIFFDILLVLYIPGENYKQRSKDKEHKMQQLYLNIKISLQMICALYSVCRDWENRSLVQKSEAKTLYSHPIHITWIIALHKIESWLMVRIVVSLTIKCL